MAKLPDLFRLACLDNTKMTVLLKREHIAKFNVECHCLMDMSTCYGLRVHISSKDSLKPDMFDANDGS